MNTLFKKNYQNFMLFFTFFLFWFSIQFGELVEDSVAFALIVSLGILHGANDLLILSKGKNGKAVFFKHLLIYLSIIVLCVVTYVLSPLVAILAFILLSSYHFGEEHMGEKIRVHQLLNAIYYMAYGLFLFSMLFYASLSDVDQIMKELTGTTLSRFQIELTLSISAMFLFTISLFLVFKKKNSLGLFLKELFYLGLLFVVFKTSSLILGFAIYFIFWHSIPSIMNQVEFIDGSLTKKGVMSYIKKALLYWSISVMALLTLYQMIPQIHLFSTIIFVVLFAVTAPHTWVMYKMKA
jgi:beta-carotene 15,15'-dioxygenase